MKRYFVLFKSGNITQQGDLPPMTLKMAKMGIITFIVDVKEGTVLANGKWNKIPDLGVELPEEVKK